MVRPLDEPATDRLLFELAARVLVRAHLPAHALEEVVFLRQEESRRLRSSPDQKDSLHKFMKDSQKPEVRLPFVAFGLFRLPILPGHPNPGRQPFFACTKNAWCAMFNYLLAMLNTRQLRTDLTYRLGALLLQDGRVPNLMLFVEASRRDQPALASQPVA